MKVYPPKRAVFRVDREQGGIFNVRCEGDLPRNSLQASEIKTKKGASRISEVVDDPLQALVIKYKEEYKSSDSLYNQFN